MNKIIIVAACLLFSSFAFAQVTEPQKIIRLGADALYIEELKLAHGREYGFLAKDLEKLFPSLVKEKRINERFGKNVYRTKIIKVIDEKALIPVMASSIKKQQVAITDLKSKIMILPKKG